MATDVTSLAYYVSRAKKAVVTKEELIAEGDYHEQIPAKIDLVKAVTLWNEMYEDALVPLVDIDLPQADFLYIADQIYNGVSFQEIRLPKSSYLGRYIDTLNSVAETAVGKEDALHTREDVENIWRSIVNPPPLPTEEANRKRSERRKAFGLVVGRVQSGKTRNYIGLILKAFDEGWNCVIVLTSNNTALAEQTFDRITGNCETAGLGFIPMEFRAGIPSCGWHPSYKYVGIAQKEVHHLANIEGWLAGITPDKLRKMKLLVIDDEADNATPDTQQNSSIIFTDADVENLAKTICPDIETDPVAKWISGLVGLDDREKAISLGLFSEDTVDARLEDLQIKARGITNKQSLFSFLSNDSVARILGLSNEVEPKLGQKQRLGELIWNVMKGDAQRSNPYKNWRNLLALVEYVFDVLPSRSRINHSVTTLFSCGDGNEPKELRKDKYTFERMAYIGYTATPYANMLNESPEEDPLASDFMYPMHTSRHYFGLERIFGIRKERRDKSSKMPIVTKLCNDDLTIMDVVRDRCEAALTSLKQIGTDSTVSDDLMVSWTDEENDDGKACLITKEWVSLKAAISWLFCAAAARRFWRKRMNDETIKRKLSHRWTTMLFNIGVDQVIHKYQSVIIQRYLDWIASSKENRDSFIQKCMGLWSSKDPLKSSFDMMKFAEVCNDYGNKITDYPSWDEIASELDWFLSHLDCRVHSVVINATPDGKQGLADYRDENHNYRNDPYAEDHIWIVCGGNTIARGLTLDGLVVTYFDRMRRSTAIDTMEQMGRWLGYREGYELLPRLWMTEDTIVEFKKMALIESIMHHELKKNFDSGYSPKAKQHYARVMHAGRRLSGRDAAMVVNGAATCGAYDTYKCFISENRQDCLNALDRFVYNGLKVNKQMIRPKAEYHAQEDNEQQFHTFPYWHDIDAEVIKEFLKRYAELQPTTPCNAISALLKEIEMKPDQQWDVVLANTKSKNGASFTLPQCGICLNVEQSTLTRQENTTQDGIVEFVKYVGNRHAFFSGVPTRSIVKTEVERIRATLLSESDEVSLPDGWTIDQVSSELAKREQDGYKQMLPSGLRKWDWGGEEEFSRMSSLEYREAVFANADTHNPILQVSLIRPSGEYVGMPFVSLSFYWPKHDETRYWWASTGSSDDDSASLPWALSSDALHDEIAAILREHSFMSRSMILNALEEKYESDVLLQQAVTNALQDGKEDYSKLDGLDETDPLEALIYKHTYYSQKWAVEVNDVIEGICNRLQLEAGDIICNTGGFMPCDGTLARCFATHKDYRYHKGTIYKDKFDDLFFEMIGRGMHLRFHFGDKENGLQGWVPNVCYQETDNTCDNMEDVKNDRQKDISIGWVDIYNQFRNDLSEDPESAEEPNQ